MIIPRPITTPAILCLIMLNVWGCSSLTSTLIETLPAQQLAAYEGQVPALVANAKQHISSDTAQRKPLSKGLLLAPIVHSYYFDYKLGANRDLSFPPY